MNILEAMKAKRTVAKPDSEMSDTAVHQESGEAQGVGFAGSASGPFSGLQPLQPGYVPGVHKPMDMDHDGVPDYMDYHFGQGQF